MSCPFHNTKYREDIPKPPDRIAKLPVHRGYPVPFFVAKVKGEWDFRVMDPAKVIQVMRNNVCWICGQPLGTIKAFVGGPLVAVNQASGEGPCHRECAEYSLVSCPYLARQMEAREAGLPEGATTQMAEWTGEERMKNPGVSVLWISKTSHLLPIQGHLWFTGYPLEVQWWTKGRLATRQECEEGLQVNLPRLIERADTEEQKEWLQRRVYLCRGLFPQV